MIPVIPWYVTLITVVTDILAGLAVWLILSTAAGRSDLAPISQGRFRIGAAIFLGGWLGAALLLAPHPSSLLTTDRFAISPMIPVFALASFAIALLAFLFSPTVRRVLGAASLPALMGVQVYRAVGFVFIVLLVQGQLPAHFAEPAGWGDIAVGLAAPVIALALARGVGGSRALAIGWNVFGLLDLFVAVGMGTGLLAAVLMPELGPRVPPAAAMGAFPMILVPLFAVPLSIILHVIALGRLRLAHRLGAVADVPASLA
ncbi:MAG: hypothetical protein ACJ8DC_03410 [Gemmatimonadales bacterium]